MREATRAVLVGIFSLALCACVSHHSGDLTSPKQWQKYGLSVDMTAQKRRDLFVGRWYDRQNSHYNATVAGTAAFGAAGVTHQDNLDIAGTFGAGATALGSAVKMLVPGCYREFLEPSNPGRSRTVADCGDARREWKMTISSGNRSSAVARLLKRALVAYLGAIGIVALAVVISISHGSGWRPAMAGMPLYVTIFVGITCQLIKEWRAIKRG